MIQPGSEKVNIQTILDGHLPEFIHEDNPKFVEFLKQYYISQEHQGGPVDIADNLNEYQSLDHLTAEALSSTSILSEDISNVSDTIIVSNTVGFPQKHGIIKIDDEIITYTDKTENSFTGCIRGFSGITNYHHDLNQEELIFSTSDASGHTESTKIENLSTLFLKEFFKKLKYTLIPGLEDTEFSSEIDSGNFIKEAKSFLRSKGTNHSFKILFNVLFGIDPSIVNLENYLFKPSAANYVRREIAIAEKISGFIPDLKGQTIFKSTDLKVTAAVSEIDSFSSGSDVFYKLFLFVGYDLESSIDGNLIITPATKCLEKVSSGSSVISVDSTIGFPESGTIVSGSNNIEYTNKTVNQFLGCSGIVSEINPTDLVRTLDTYFGYENGDTSKKVELRLVGILSEFEQISDYGDLSVGDSIYIKSLGEDVRNENKTYLQKFANSLIYNTRTRYNIQNLNTNNSGFTLKTLSDRSSLKVGDSVEVLRQNSNIPDKSSDVNYIKEINGNQVLLNEISPKSVINGEDGKDIIAYSLRRELKKVRSSNSEVPIEPGNNLIIGDVQNLYIDDKQEFAYIASNSLPSANIDKVGVDDILGTFSYDIDKKLKKGVLSSDNGILTDRDPNDVTSYAAIQFPEVVRFLTGDKIIYKASGTVIGGLENNSAYYVEVVNNVNSTKIRLYLSGSQIDGVNYIKLSLPNGISRENNLTIPENEEHKFILYSQRSEIISAKNILKKFSLNPNNKYEGAEVTTPGTTGILINGVEILNYKSSDYIYYGGLENLSVPNKGKNYDVINLPKLVVDDPVVSGGTTSVVRPVISGSFKDILVSNNDFNIEEITSIDAIGGNGKNAVFEPVFLKKKKELLFSATDLASGDDTTGIDNDQILFTLPHGLKTNDKVTYNSNLNTNPVSGLNDGQEYFIQYINDNTIKLAESIEDLNSGTYISLGSNNIGVHKFEAGKVMNILSEIKIINPGEDYTNRELLVPQSGIVTQRNVVNYKNHGFSHGDIIEYKPESPTGTIVGLNTNNQYRVLKIDDDTFKVCDVGVGATISSNFERLKNVYFSTTGTGNQIFKYPDIQVKVNYIGDSDILTTTPIVRGSIIDAYLYEKGSSYGSYTLNVEKKPNISIKNGEGAKLQPVILGGKLQTIKILSKGVDYNSLPDIIIEDSNKSLGSGAKIKPNILDGKLDSVEVLNPGAGYSDECVLKVVPSGQGAKFEFNIRKLTLDNAFSNRTNPNDIRYGDEVLIGNDSLNYTICGYGEKIRNAFGESNLSEKSPKHSKIIGWAYDGNPIYGPFGYEDPNVRGGIIRRMKSGYVSSTQNVENRPPTENLDIGSFIEDYKFDPTNSDLDIYNGRFCKTDEFPNGVYAYFATINPAGYSQFPYFIGDLYKSNTLRENISLRQGDIETLEVYRNTFPYRISDTEVLNDFLIEKESIKKQVTSIESVFDGSVENIEVINGGNGYKINDLLTFDNKNTFGSGLSVAVSKLDGKEIDSVVTSIDRFEDVVFTWESSNKVSGETSVAHNFKDGDHINISGFSTQLSEINGFQKISVENLKTNTLSTCTSQTVGYTTEIYVSSIPDTVSIGSSVAIGTENMEILNIFPEQNILRLRRSIFTEHSIGSTVEFLSKTFTFSPTKNLETFDSKRVDIVYWNPLKSIGIGTTVGINTTFDFAGRQISRIIPSKSIYLENHPFKNNQKVNLYRGTTDDVFRIGIKTSSDTTNYTFVPSGADSDPVEFYVVKRNNDLIGLKTSLTGPELYFELPSAAQNPSPVNSNTVLNFYRFESVPNQIKGNIEKITATVSVSTPHELSVNDIVSLDIAPSTSIGIGTSTIINVSRDLNFDNLIFNPIGFSSSGINTNTNTITINSHGLKTEDKVSYYANEFPSGISTEKYYIYKVDDDNIKLCETLVDVRKNPPTVISIASTGGSDQKIGLINPRINVTKNNNLKFNLIDNSLSGYDFKIYFDKELKNEFNTTGNLETYNVVRVGSQPGDPEISLTINYDEQIPDILYYGLEKSGEIIPHDEEVVEYGEINYVSSFYNDTYNVSALTSTTFDVPLKIIPEDLNYSKLDSSSTVLKYTTESKTASGSVNSLRIISSGEGYKKLPTFTGTNSENGIDLSVLQKSSIIGKIGDLKILNHDFEYSSDKTLYPSSLISPTLIIKDFSKIDSISVLNGSFGYTDPPSIALVHPETGVKIDSGSFKVNLSGSSIFSVEPDASTTGLPDNSVKIFTENNSNGFGVQSVVSSATTSTFTIKLQVPRTGFNPDSPPFENGDEIFVEGITKNGTDGSGFNSKDYGYKFFTVQGFDADTGSIIVKLGADGDNLTTRTGVANVTQGGIPVVVNKKNYPTFSTVQSPSKFIIGEQLSINGILVDLFVMRQDRNFVYIFGSYEPVKNDILVGSDSGTTATVSNFNINKGRFKIKSTSNKNIGWEDNVGKLNLDDQVISDNDYYQNLSYTIKSPLTFNEIKTPVNNLVHTIGTKNFADVGITSSASTSGIGSEIYTIITKDFITENRVDAINNFDLGYDYENIDDKSKFIEFRNKKLVPYINNISNTVLNIDDISPLFSNLESDPFKYIQIIDSDTMNSYQNYLIRVTDLNNKEIQFSEFVVSNTKKNQFLIQKNSVAGLGSESINSQLNIKAFSVGTISQGDSTITGINTDGISEGFIVQTTTDGILQEGTTVTSVGDNQVELGSSALLNSPTDEIFKFGIFDNLRTSIGKFELIRNNETNNVSFNFIPEETDDIDYDLKILTVDYKQEIAGTGSKDIGFIKLLETTKQIANSGIGSTVLTLSTNEFKSFFFTAQIEDINDENNLNFVELYGMVDGDDTYLAEYYFDSSTSPLSSASIGTFELSKNDSNMILKYSNNSSNDVDIRSKTICFRVNNNTVGTHYFDSFEGQTAESVRSIAYEASYGSDSSYPLTVFEVDSDIVNSFKSTVEITATNSGVTTSSLHQIMVAHIPEDNKIFISQGQVMTNDTTNELSSISGLGTFGAVYDNTNIVLKFYPDDENIGSITSKSFNQYFYTVNDVLNIPRDLTYGSLKESLGIRFYNAINGSRINQTSFEALSNGVPIFAKTFNPSSVLDLTTGIFTINNHFFRNNEEIIYTPRSGLIGVNASSMVMGDGNALPETLYVKYINDNQFRVSETNGGPSITSFNGHGGGNRHEFAMKKNIGKSIIVIDDIVQHPIVSTDLQYTLPSDISSTTETFVLSGISSIVPLDILKIDDEFMRVVNVGLGTQTTGPITGTGSNELVSVERGFVGTSATNHNSNNSTTIVDINRGSFNIVGNKIHLTAAPKGNPNSLFNESRLLTPRSEFQGRVFLRNDYTTNIIYDDISNQFDGLTTSFTLKQNGNSISGIGTTGGNGLLFVNGIFQTPKNNNNTRNNYYIEEDTVAGISTLIFTGMRSPENIEELKISSYDINQNQLPRGGIIVSYGSTPGMGYAQLVPAKAIATVGTGGAIQDIVGVSTHGTGIDITGAEYDNVSGILNVTTATNHDFDLGIANQVKLERLEFSCSSEYDGLTTTFFPDDNNDGTSVSNTNYDIIGIGGTNTFTVNVGPSTIKHTYVGSGTAYPYYAGLNFGSGYRDGHVSVGITDPVYTHKFVSANTNAITVVSSADNVPSNNTNITPTFATYNPSNGDLTITANDHNLEVDDTISIDDESIVFTCSKDDYSSNHSYPRSSDPASTSNAELNNGVLSISATTSDTFTVNVGSAVGSGANVTVVVGAGGTLDLSIASGDGGSNYKNPIVTITSPKYENLDVIGISRIGEGNTTDTGTGFKISLDMDIVSSVGIGSTRFGVKNFKILNYGYSFKKGDKFTPVGLVTASDLSEPLEQFVITVEDVYTDSYALWQFGEFDFIDDIKDNQDGVRTKFKLNYNEELQSFEKSDTSNIELDKLVLVFINGILQKPGINYIFEGGTSIIFTEPPKPDVRDAAGTIIYKGDDVSIFFYRGTTGVDSQLFDDVFPNIEIGDKIQLIKNNNILDSKTQKTRVISDLSKSDLIETNLYTSQGIETDLNKSKSISIIRKKRDVLLNSNEFISKSRSSIFGRVNPSAKIISDVGITSTTIYLDNVSLFKENDIDSATGAFYKFKSIIVDPYESPVGLASTAGGRVETITSNESSTVIVGKSGIITAISKDASNNTITFTSTDSVDDFGGISVGEPIYISNTKIGSGVTSLGTNGTTIVGVGTTLLDNIYHVSAKSAGTITCNVSATTDLSWDNVDNHNANYSWGKITSQVRDELNPIEITVNGRDVVAGLSTFPTLQRRSEGFRNTGSLPINTIY